MLKLFQRCAILSCIFFIFCTLHKRFQETLAPQKQYKDVWSDFKLFCSIVLAFKDKIMFFSCVRAEHCMKAELQVGDASSAPNDCNYQRYYDDRWMLHGKLCGFTHTKSHSCTWDKDGQQLLDGVHGVDEHLPVLLVRQLLLPLLNHLGHFCHPWRKRRRTWRSLKFWESEINQWNGTKR